jgi:uncharacterized protein (DUF1697 family)
VTAYVAFLRAVNVGGKNKVPMARLRDALAAAGLEEIATVLQSGNVVFRSRASAGVAAKVVAGTVEETFGLQIGVVIRSATELAAVAATNPFLDQESDRDAKTLHVAFLSARPGAAAVAKLDPDRSPPDSFAVSGREIYLSYPEGSGRSRLTLDYLEKALGVTGTARNWRTVQRLATLLEASSA